MAVILGIHGAVNWDANEIAQWLHGAGASLFIDGKHHTSILEERLNRNKQEGNYPHKSIEYVLQNANISKKDVDYVAHVDAPYSVYYEAYFNYEFDQFFKTDFPKAEYHQCKHHISHAAASFYTSPFDQSSIVTLDGGGSYMELGHRDRYVGDCGSFSLGHKKKGIVNVNRMFHPFYKFGFLYHYAAPIYYMLMGEPKTTIHVDTFPGKVMGLAGYGDSSKVDLPDIMRITKDDFFPLVQSSNVDMDKFRKYDPKDLAAWLQDQFSKSLITFLKNIGDHNKNLCYGGGCALNILANTEIINQGIYDNLHVFPGTNDDGQSFGAAIWLAQRIEKEITLPDNLGTLGRYYNDGEIKSAIGSREHTEFKSYDELNNYVAGKLVENKVIGWFQDGSEYGPRALGNRSILANPTIAANKDYINEKIKFREWWRPYAPIILEDHQSSLVDFDRPSPYMLFSGNVLNDSIPAVTHTDGTTRIQTVNKQQNKKVYDLINAFREATGVPALLNTSFNIAGEPIVESPEDALNTFNKSNLDILVMGKFVVERRTS